MPQLRSLRSSEVLRWGLIGSTSGVGVVLLLAVIAAWSHGKRQAADVAALLAVAPDASIQAQYGPYQYQPPAGLNEPLEPGTLRLILGGGQRVQGFSVVGDPPRHVELLTALLGEDCLARVTDIHVNDERFSDADVELLLAFPDLREVDLSGSALTEIGLTRLASGCQLVKLNLSGTQVTSAALRQLAQCKSLKELDLRDTSAGAHLTAELQQALPDCWILTND